jgi:hypothetical protein
MANNRESLYPPIMSDSVQASNPDPSNDIPQSQKPIDPRNKQPKLYGCHSSILPNHNPIVTADDGYPVMRTEIVVQDGYSSPHPLVPAPEDYRLTKTPLYKIVRTDWLPIRCGHATKLYDSMCANCNLLATAVPNVRV